ncbi:MAG: putative rane protein [Rhodocyclales bacterium]|nr:putative rane protein [Rhodocyclales bacterium]
MQPNDSQRPRVLWLDPLRFVAALAVMLYHFGFRGYAADSLSVMPYPFLAGLAKYGFLGVDLFFLISGFVILMTAERTLTARAFCVSRAIRLYPAFLVCCSITFVTKALLGESNTSLTEYLLNMTLVGGLTGVHYVAGVYWSLIVELKFYILMALIIRFDGVKRIETVYWLWLVAAAASSAIGWMPLKIALIGGFAHYFVAGGALYLIHRRGVSTGRIGLLTISGAWVLWSVYGHTLQLQTQFSTRFSPLLACVIASGFFVVFLGAPYLQRERRSDSSRASRFLVLLGAITYPLYLVHEDLGYILINWLYPAFNAHVVLVLTIVSMLTLSYAIQKFIEAPAMRILKDRFVKTPARKLLVQP